jgi:hypothetical protein
LALALGLWMSGLAGSIAYAGVTPSAAHGTDGPKVVPAEERQRPGSDAAMPSSQAAERARIGAPTIKCWQEGRAIFEEWQWGARGDTGASTVLSRETDQAELHLLDFGETFCVLQRNGASGE